MDKDLITKHTPGPWAISKHCSTLVETSIGSRNICSAGGYTSNVTFELPTNEANARLIAAAPDMYNLLKELASLLWKPLDTEQLIDLSASAGNLLSKIEDED